MLLWQHRIYTFLAAQPRPPTIICRDTNRCGFKNFRGELEYIDDRGKGNFITLPDNAPTRNETQEALNRFCSFRDTGVHPLPILCDVFIYCDNGKGSFDVCPENTKFNPEFFTCDHAANFECAFTSLNRK